jgi:uncharacterized protein with HEPN domain
MPREELFLQDIIEAADAIDSFLSNVLKENFLQSDLIQSAVLQKLAVIGEASARISDNLRNAHPEIPWRQIIGFRNIAIHAYFSINWETVWIAATKNAPLLREQIKEILENEFPDFELRTKTNEQ